MWLQLPGTGTVSQTLHSESVAGILRESDTTGVSDLQ